MTKASAKRRTPKKADPMRAGRVAIVGRPNAGKSTLLNALVGMRLAIATDKPGTTRSSILGVGSFDDPPTQIAFVDTPGLHRPKSALGSVLVEEAERGLVDVDAVVLVVTSPTDTDFAKGKDLASIPSEADAAALALAASAEKPVVLVVNKIDRLKDKRNLLPVLERWAAVHSFAALVPLSALRASQLENLVSALREHLPEGRLFEDDYVTDRSERFLVAELVREAAMEQTRQEVPHGLAVTIDRFLEQDGRAHVMATLVVEKESHKGIVLGRGGARIKAIGTAARTAAERLLERPVYLELWVRVEPSWTSDPDRARRRVRDVEGT